MSLTIIILTKNEEKNIEDAINSAFKCCFNILVVDSGSTDNTVKLAKNMGAKVIYRAWDNDFSAQRNFALEHVETEWVLYLDADERLSTKLVEAINEAITSNEDKQYVFKRKSIAFGKEFNYGTLRPDYVPRLFKTTHVQWINKVHEKPICNDKPEVLNGYIKHFTYGRWEQWIEKFNKYTTIWAQDAHSKGIKSSIHKAIFHSFFGFWQMLVLKKGILDGGMGIALCLMHAFYTLAKYLKLIELQNSKEVG